MNTLFRCVSTSSKRRLLSSTIVAALASTVSLVHAAPTTDLPSPLDAATVIRLAREHRPEITAARARASAAGERPKIVSALPDPMLMVSADMIPFALDGVDGSITAQQEFPLSNVRGNRRRAAEADADRLKEDVRRAALDVEFEALSAYFMVAELRATSDVLKEQIGIVEQVAGLAREHLAAGQGMQADVLRLDNERARLQSDQQALGAEILGSEAMLNTTLARTVEALIPPIAWTDELSEPLPLAKLAQRGLERRPELASARAERARAVAEIDVMRSMYNPMALVKVGPAYSMQYGAGVMAMVGVSVPIWRERLGAGVAEARAMSAMTDADIDAMKRTIAGSIASARAAVISSRTRLVSLREDILPRSRLVVESAVASFAAGQSPMIAVLDTTRDLRDVRMQEIMVRSRLATAWAKLRRETGELE